MTDSEIRLYVIETNLKTIKWMALMLALVFINVLILIIGLAR